MRKLVRFISLLFIFLFTISFFSCQNGKANNVYYVSIKGNNRANGRTPETAWKSISKVNSLTLSPGDSVLFEAGGVWREILDVDPGRSGKGNRTYYGRFGKGKNPEILGSEKAENWTPTGVPNIWKSATILIDPRGIYPGELFFIKNDSTSWGDFQDHTTALTNLNQEFHWTYSEGIVYVYSTTDPDTQFESIEVPQRDYCIRATNSASSYIEINGIDLFYAKISGYRNGWPEVTGATDLTLKNLRIGYIGAKSSSAAYGIEAFHSNFLVDSCIITDCGRRGISINLYKEPVLGSEIYLRNIVVRNCIFKRGQHTTSLDLAAEDVCKGDTITDVFFYNNTIDDHEKTMTGEDATSNQLYYQQGTGAYFNKIYTYNNLFIQATARNIQTALCDTIYVWNNTFIGHNPTIPSSPYANINFTYTKWVDYRNNISYDNLPNDDRNNYGLLMEYPPSDYLARDYNLYYQEIENPARRGFTGGYRGYYTMSDWLSYRRSNPKFDIHSPRPANPDFLDYTNFDFRLSPKSKAKNAGTPISIVVSDITGKPRDPVHPSIGAFE